MTWIKRIGAFLLLLYLAACVGLFFGQEQLIFHPKKLPASYVFGEGEEAWVPVSDGVRLNGLWLRSQAPRGVILYWHGNVGSNRRCLRQAENLFDLGYDIFMPDYRGYGKSGGEIFSEDQLFADAQKVYTWLLQYYREDQIVLVGYSLGSGVSTYLASHNHPQRLCLVAPYRSMAAMKNLLVPFVPSFLLKYPLRNEVELPQANCPVSLFHGTRDELIPYAHSVVLQSKQPTRSRLISLGETGHRGAIFSQILRRELAAMLR
jgi:uncharacterized protein